MKQRLTFLIALITIAASFAQNGINYKAIIKDDLGNVVANQSIDVQFIIYEGAALTNNVYQESHTLNSDSNGIIITNIGEGSTSDVFSDINWGNDEHFLNVQVDTGSGLVDLGTTKFMAVPYALNAANVSGLEAIDEGNGIGWRLLGRNPDNYDDIGKNAIDFSFVNNPNLGLGATGDFAFSLGQNGTASGEYALIFGNQNYATNDYALALGNNNIVSGLNSTAIGAINQVTGDYSFAVGLLNEASDIYTVAIGNATTASQDYAIATGQSTIASGINSTAMGFSTEASGSTSTAFGRLTIASGSQSTAIGYLSEASEFSSTAMGTGTIASGAFSTAMGHNTNASAYASTAIGRYNVGGGNATQWSYNDPLFEIGNGDSNSIRRNALTVYKNGSHLINSQTTGLNINAEYLGLNISNSGNDAIFINNSGNNGIQISSPTSAGVIITNPGNSGLYITNAGDFGADIAGDTAGLTVSSTTSSNPDIILRGNSSANASDDGIISSDPSYAGSDLYFRSNDAVVIQLDYDDNDGSSSFIVKNGDDSNVFTVNESGNATLAGSLTQNSDRRLKKNITDLDYGLNEILQLQPKQYFWKNQQQTKKSLGLIAQDVQTIISEIVTSQDDELKTLGISYTELIPVLIKAIQEQQLLIESQKISVSNQDLINQQQSQTIIKQAQAIDDLLSRVEAIEQATN